MIFPNSFLLLLCLFMTFLDKYVLQWHIEILL